MDIQPAHVDQVRRASDGRFVEIHADAGNVVDDLKRIDAGFGVRFAENGDPPYWHVYHRTDDGDGRRTDRLVLSVKAYRTGSGVWAGLDQRVVRRVELIGHESYDFAGEVARQNAQADRDRDRVFAERIGAHAEQAAAAARKDLGLRYQGRAFIPRSVS
jgi:hypothetical protein